MQQDLYKIIKMCKKPQFLKTTGHLSHMASVQLRNWIVDTRPVCLGQIRYSDSIWKYVIWLYICFFFCAKMTNLLPSLPPLSVLMQACLDQLSQPLQTLDSSARSQLRGLLAAQLTCMWQLYCTVTNSCSKGYSEQQSVFTLFMLPLKVNARLSWLFDSKWETKCSGLFMVFACNSLQRLLTTGQQKHQQQLVKRSSWWNDTTELKCLDMFGLHHKEMDGVKSNCFQQRQRHFVFRMN